MFEKSPVIFRKLNVRAGRLAMLRALEYLRQQKPPDFSEPGARQRLSRQDHVRYPLIRGQRPGSAFQVDMNSLVDMNGAAYPRGLKRRHDDRCERTSVLEDCDFANIAAVAIQAFEFFRIDFLATPKDERFL